MVKVCPGGEEREITTIDVVGYPGATVREARMGFEKGWYEQEKKRVAASFRKSSADFLVRQKLTAWRGTKPSL